MGLLPNLTGLEQEACKRGFLQWLHPLQRLKPVGAQLLQS